MEKLAKLLTQKSLTISVAESCTGGNLSAALTSVSGSSKYFEAGFITYSNQAKIDMLGVKKSTLDSFGAVSKQTALEMARGVIKKSKSDIGITTTGVAGPTGGTKDKPVGMVCFGFCILGECFTTIESFKGDRNKIVASSVDFAIKTLKKHL